MLTPYCACGKEREKERNWIHRKRKYKFLIKCKKLFNIARNLRKFKLK